MDYENNSICYKDWEFTIPLTVSIITTKRLEYAEVRKMLTSIPAEKIAEIFTNALSQYKEKLITPGWIADGTKPCLKEGIYLRSLTYNEKYKHELPKEEPLPLPMSNHEAVCQICGKITPFTDEGGRCETEVGWMCHGCIEEAHKQGEELHFQDEDFVE